MLRLRVSSHFNLPELKWLEIWWLVDQITDAQHSDSNHVWGIGTYFWHCCFDYRRCSIPFIAVPPVNGQFSAMDILKNLLNIWNVLKSCWVKNVNARRRLEALARLDSPTLSSWLGQKVDYDKLFFQQCWFDVYHARDHYALPSQYLHGAYFCNRFQFIYQAQPVLYYKKMNGVKNSVSD